MEQKLNSIAFNQDFTCIAIGTDSHYKILNCDPFGTCFEKTDDGGANLVEMLFSTSLIAIVGNGNKPTNSSRRLKILNIKKKSILCELTFPSQIISIKLNRKRLIVILIDQIYIYDISCIKLLHIIETNNNTLKLGDLSSHDKSFLVIPYSLINESTNLNGELVPPSDLNESNKNGFLLLYDAINLKPIKIFKTHKTPLQILKISNNGEMIATASIKGTIIRIFNSNGNKLFNLRRGNSLSKINCLSFSLNNLFLSVSSNHDTIHVFKLDNSIDNIHDNESPDDGYISDHSISSLNENLENLLNQQTMQQSQQIQQQMSSTQSTYSLNSLKSKLLNQNFINYIPYNNYITNIFEPKRSFAFLKLPISNHPNSIDIDIKSVIGIDLTNNNIMICTNDGWFYVYNLNIEQGGECVLLKQYSLLGES